VIFDTLWAIALAAPFSDSAGNKFRDTCSKSGIATKKLYEENGMRNLKKALISTAVLAGLAAGNAYAGTEACFEIYKGEVTDHAVSFGGAECYVGSPAVRSSDLLGLDEGKVAYELTRGGANGYAIELGDVAFRADPTEASEGVQIVYIPTTDIPGASRIEVTLSNAVFNGNSNQIYLLGHTGAILATSDGVVDGQNKVEFLTQSGVTIPAGTRMLFSRTNGIPAGDYDTHRPVGILTQNTSCTDPTSAAKITIKATSARTDGGSNIIGGVSRAEDLIDISAQFVTFIGSATDAQVNAQSTNFAGNALVARTEFVFDDEDDEGLKLRRTDIIAPMGFVDRIDSLDIAHTLVAADTYEMTFNASSAAGSSVRFGIFNTQDADGSLDGQVALNTTATGVFANYGVNGETYELPAPAVFDLVADASEAGFIPATYADEVAAGNYNVHFFTVSQRDTDVPMNFNYTVGVNHKLDFNAATLLDHCAADKNTHNIGINGAVLKVPYVVSAEGNFVRITNEHDQAAEVTVDVFGESADGTTSTRAVTAVTLGTVPAQSSVVYFVPEIISQAQSQKNYTGADGGFSTGSFGSNAQAGALRHSLTFAVTAPRDSVHGVSVQKIPGGVDRVMPVLDQNNWNQ
jgi:hypothetical protein